MADYSNEDYSEMIIIYGECNRNAEETAREYSRRFPTKQHPSPRFVRRLVNRLRSTGSCIPQRGRHGHHQSALSSELEIDILAYFASYPHASVRSAESELGVSSATVWRTLQRHGWRPYSLHFHQALLPSDYQRRFDFCNWALAKEDELPNFLRNVIFTDECCFAQDGTINLHNEHFWSDRNEYVVRQINHQHRFATNVWCGIWNNRLIGPILYQGTLTGDRYLNLILNSAVSDFLDELPLAIRQHIWYQQDGAGPHNHSRVIRWLQSEFPNRWIGLRGPVEWPPRSPDLTPLDFYLWGHLRCLVYATQPTNITDLCMRIERACRQITAAELERVQNAIINRLQLCIGVNGGHFEPVV